MGCLYRESNTGRRYSKLDSGQNLWKDKLLDKVGPQKFSGKLKGNIENILTDTEVGIYKKYGITYSKLRVKRENYDLVVTTNQDQSFDIWES